MLEISGQRKNKAFFVATGYIVAFWARQRAA